MLKKEKKLNKLESLEKISFTENVLRIKGSLGELNYLMKGKSLVSYRYGLKILDYTSYRLMFLKFLKISNVLLEGYYVEVEFHGLGYRFINLENKVLLRIGYSHYIYYQIPLNVLIFGFRRNLIIFSASKDLVLKMLSLFRYIKKDNVYKQKGIYIKGFIKKLKGVKVNKK